MTLPKTLLREEEFQSGLIRDAVKLVNFIWLLARVHRRPEALRFLGALARALAPHFRRLGATSGRRA